MPDGKIVFESKDQDIWVVGADGNNKRQLTNEASSDIKPIVASDGRSIVFSSNRSGVNHLWRMNIDGSDQKQLTQIEGGYAECAALDGRVYYQAGFSGALRKIDAETKTENDLADIGGWAHAFCAKRRRGRVIRAGPGERRPHQDRSAPVGRPKHR
jgi:tricorn protease-like protein